MHVWEIEEVRTRFSWRDLRNRDYFEERSVDWRMILKWTFKK